MTAALAPTGVKGIRLHPAENASAYGSSFWFAYASQTTLMIAVSLLFRYADFIRTLGGSEWHVGWIVGAGMIGGVSMRLFQGIGIDRYGPRWVFLGSLALLIASLLGHLLVESVDSPFLYALRIMFATSIAGAFGASISHISSRAPVSRVAEVVGTLGTSGFVGMVLGTNLGDLLFPAGTATDRWHQDRLFVVTAALATVAMILGWCALAGHQHHGRRRSPPVWRLIRRFHPGLVLLVGVAGGIGVAVPQVFLRTFAAELHIPKLGSYFLVYCIVAFTARLTTRGLPARHGIRPMAILGLAMLALSMLAYLPAEREWHLLLPAALAGVAHALLFPSVVGGGSVYFPARFRGLGTTLMLASFDFGTLIGGPLIGSTLHTAKYFGLPAYTILFVFLAVLLGGCGALFASSGRGRPHDSQVQRRHRRVQLGTQRAVDAASRRVRAAS